MAWRASSGPLAGSSLARLTMPIAAASPHRPSVLVAAKVATAQKASRLLRKRRFVRQRAIPSQTNGSICAQTCCQTRFNGNRFEQQSGLPNRTRVTRDRSRSGPVAQQRRPNSRHRAIFWWPKSQRRAHWAAQVEYRRVQLLQQLMRGAETGLGALERVRLARGPGHGWTGGPDCRNWVVGGCYKHSQPLRSCGRRPNGRRLVRGRFAALHDGQERPALAWASVRGLAGQVGCRCGGS